MGNNPAWPPPPRRPAHLHLQGASKAGRHPRKDARGRWADFHSLRYTSCTWMARRHAIEYVQRLMRHPTIKLTADWYNDLGLEDIGQSVWSLPPLSTATVKAPRTAPRRPLPAGRGLPLPTSWASLPFSLLLPQWTTTGGANRLRPCSLQTLVFQQIRAERAGFEPAVGFDPHAALAMCRPDTASADSAITSDAPDPRLTAPLTGTVENACESLREIDPDLARVVTAWPDLPAHIRAAVLALVGTAR